MYQAFHTSVHRLWQKHTHKELKSAGYLQTGSIFYTGEDLILSKFKLIQDTQLVGDELLFQNKGGRSIQIPY